jgi:uncharacterized membrane protein YozB (DUF420 family)
MASRHTGGMSSVMEAPTRTVPKDRVFYTGMAVFMAIIVFVGFSPTFFQRPAELPALAPLFTLHGVVFSAWMALLIVQTSLIAADRRAWHRTLGAFGAALALGMIVLGMLAAINSLNRGVAPLPGLDPRSFFAIPVRDIVTFAMFVGAAVYWRRDAEMHKRLMLLATIALLAAAIARTPGVVQFGPPMFYGLQDLLIVIGMVYDRITRGAVHRVWWWGLGLTLGSQVLFLAIAKTGPWLAFADLFVGL